MNGFVKKWTSQVKHNPPLWINPSNKEDMDFWVERRNELISESIDRKHKESIAAMQWAPLAALRSQIKTVPAPLNTPSKRKAKA
jgi:hypothetical protein